MFNRDGLREFAAGSEQNSSMAATDVLDVRTSFSSRKAEWLDERDRTMIPSVLRQHSK